MTKIYSNKLNVSVSSGTPTPVTKGILTVSSDGVNYSTSASGHKLYFKVQTYNANGQPANTIIRGITNITTSGITGTWNVDFITYGQLYYENPSNQSTKSVDAATTKNGVLLFSVEWSKACVSQVSSTQLFGNPQASMNLGYDTLTNHGEIDSTNNVNYQLAPETICTPKNIDITFPVNPQVTTCTDVFSNQTINTYIFNLQPNQTYNLTIKVTDSNGNPCPNCVFNEGLHTNGDGIAYYKWTAPENLADFMYNLPLISNLSLETASGNDLQAVMGDFNFTVNGIPCTNNVFISTVLQQSSSSQISPDQIKVSMQNNYTTLIVTGSSSLIGSRLFFYDPQTNTVNAKATYTACYATTTSWGASECMVGPVTQDIGSMGNRPDNGTFYDSGNGTATAQLDLMGQPVTTDINNVTMLYFVIAPQCIPENYKPNIIIELTGITAYPPGNCSDIGCRGTVQVQLVKRCLMVAPNTDNNYTPCTQRTIIECIPLNYNCHCPL